MKKKIQSFLQKALGLNRYLFWFACWKFWTLRWDRHEQDFFFFLNFLKPEHTVLDIGGNLGFTAATLARRVKKVHTFEPLPPNFSTLQRVVRFFKLKNIEAHAIAIGNENSTVQMVLPEVERVQMQGLSHVVHDDLTDFNDGRRFVVPLKRLDDLDFLKNTPIHAIKLDVENFEFFALQGGEQLLRQHRPIVYTELWDNDNRYRCFDLMQALDFEIKIHHNGQLVDYQPDTHLTQNFFFLKKP